jgi:hypothetical protein
MKILLVIMGLLFLFEAMADEQKIIYQYKKYEKFDLGNLEVKGELIAPGDISVRERDRRKFELDLFTRKDFDTFLKRDVESLR